MNNFDSPHKKLLRVAKLVEDVKALIDSFIKQQPFAYIKDKDAQTGRFVHKIMLTKELPEEVTEKTIYIVDHLRSCLNQAVYAIAALNPNCNLRSVDFPIYDNVEELEQFLKKNKADLPRTVLDLLRDFRPYKNGNGLIWALHKSRCREFHRFTEPVATASIASRIDEIKLNGGEEVFLPQWNYEKQEIVFATSEENKDLVFQITVLADVVFGKDEVEFLAGRSIKLLLEAMLSEVQIIVVELEKEFLKYA